MERMQDGKLTKMLYVTEVEKPGMKGGEQDKWVYMK